MSAPTLSRFEIVSTETGYRFTCTQCGVCCSAFTVRLTAERYQRLRDVMRANPILGDPDEALIPFDNPSDDNYAVLKRRHEDDSCYFLRPDNRCAIQVHVGAEEKPGHCRAFPHFPLRVDDRIMVGVTTTCVGIGRLYRSIAEREPGDPAPDGPPGTDPEFLVSAALAPETIQLLPGLDISPGAIEELGCFWRQFLPPLDLPLPAKLVMAAAAVHGLLDEARGSRRQRIEREDIRIREGFEQWFHMTRLEATLPRREARRLLLGRLIRDFPIQGLAEPAVTYLQHLFDRGDLDAIDESLASASPPVRRHLHAFAADTLWLPQLVVSAGYLAAFHGALAEIALVELGAAALALRGGVQPSHLEDVIRRVGFLRHRVAWVEFWKAQAASSPFLSSEFPITLFARRVRENLARGPDTHPVMPDQDREVYREEPPC